MPSPEDISAVLENYLREEITLYREVRELSRSQLTQIQDNNTAALLEVVSMKQERIARIETIERAAAPFKQMREATLESWPTTLRSRLATLVRELQSLLGEIVGLEEQSRAAAEARVGAAKERLQSAQTGKAMLNAYTTGKRPQPPKSGTERNA